ncbi:MAG: AraC family transcriptional regulator [Clostridia bacterium]|nr:AraC family transcriptional regulator [Clostridia bacterium]
MIYYQTSDGFFKDNAVFSLMRYVRGTGLHWHDAPEFMYIKSGELSVTLDGVRYLAGPGDVVTVNSSVLHASKKLDLPLDYYILFANNDFFKTNGLYGETTHFEPFIKDDKLSAIFDSIINEHERLDDFTNLATLSRVIDFFVYLNRFHRLGSEEISLDDDKKLVMVRRTLLYLQENYNKKLTVEKIAEALHFSKSYLSHSFKQITKYSLMSYINLLRCQNARSLMLDGYSVSEASSECGFSDIPYFTRVFKKTMGVLPSKINKEVFSQHQPKLI